MRWALLLVVACIAVGLATPGPCRAADAADAKAKDADNKDHKKDGKDHKKDDKIDLFKGWLDLTVWTIAVFLLLFFVLSTFAWPQIRAGLDKREADIAQAHEDAKAAKQEAIMTRQDLEAQRAAADQDVRAKMDKQRADAEAAAAAREAQSKAEIATERTRLREEMDRARAQALQEIWSQGAVLATLISAKTIRKNLTEEDHRALVDDALKEFRAAAESRVHDLTGAQE